MPETLEQVVTELSETEGVETHAQSEDGRIVVVVEDTEERQASEIIMAMHQMPGVVSLTLTYHHFEDSAATSASPHHPSQLQQAGAQ